MPQLVADGPNLPHALIEAWDQDRAIFFCGAGVSARARLPLFNDLVRHAYKKLSAMPPRKADPAWAFPDRLLSRLEQDFTSGAVRSAVVQRLLADNGDITSHKALIELARLRERSGLRLVTTNFDRLFEHALAEVGLSACRYSAPLLPTPSDDADGRFQGLIYLHGRISDDSDHRNLVLTSPDFGRAYLTDGYARRFVLRLVQEFTPVFVGYSLADPVLRYIFDAIGAERAARRLPEARPSAFIFRSAKEQQPLPEGVVGIPYDPRTEQGIAYGLLHTTLEAWATWRDRKARVREAWRADPAGLPLHERALVAWSVSGEGHEPGFGAAILDDLCRQSDSPPPSLGWLDVLERAEAERLAAHRDEMRAWEEKGQKGPSLKTPALPLRDLMAPTHDAMPLPAGAGKLALWLVRHLDDPALVTWTVARLHGYGTRLHPHLRRLIRARLTSADDGQPTARVWRWLTAEAEWAKTSHSWNWRPSSIPPFDEVLSRIDHDELLACLAPRLQLAPSTSRELESRLSRAMGGALDQSRPWSLQHLVDVKVMLSCNGLAPTIVRRARSLPAANLSQLAWPVTDLLDRALSLLDWRNGLGTSRDSSPQGHPINVAPEHVHDWQLLRPLLWSAWRALDERDATSSRLLIERWRLLGRPTFQRFAVAAMGASPHVATEELLRYLLSDGASLLWDLIPRDELEQPLQRLWCELDPDKRAWLLDAILSPPDEQQSAPHDGRGARLAILARSGGPDLPRSASRHLEVFEAARAAASAARETVTAEELLDLGDDALARRLRTDTSQECERAWSEAVECEPDRALQLIPILLAEDQLPTRPLLEVVWRTSPPRADKKLALDALHVFAAVPADMLACRPDLVVAMSGFIRRIAEAPWHEPDVSEPVLRLWDRLISLIDLATSPVEAEELLDLPVDDLVTTVLLALEREQSAEATVGTLSRLDRLTSDAALFPAALRTLGRSLPFLDAVAPDWTARHLLPAFDWRSHPEQAARAWEAYLSAAGLMTTKLWPRLRVSLLDTFSYLDRLSSHAHEMAVQLLLAVVLYPPGRTLSDHAARSALRACDEPMLNSAAWFLWHTVEDEPSSEQRDQLWRERLGRVVSTQWPRNQALQHRRSWAWLLRMAIALGEAFPEAVDAILTIPAPLRIESEDVLDDLATSNHPDRPERVEAARRLLRLLIERSTPDRELIAEIEARFVSSAGTLA